MKPHKGPLDFECFVLWDLFSFSLLRTFTKSRKEAAFVCPQNTRRMSCRFDCISCFTTFHCANVLAWTSRSTTMSLLVSIFAWPCMDLFSHDSTKYKLTCSFQLSRVWAMNLQVAAVSPKRSTPVSNFISRQIMDGNRRHTLRCALVFSAPLAH